MPLLGKGKASIKVDIASKAIQHTFRFYVMHNDNFLQ